MKGLACCCCSQDPICLSTLVFQKYSLQEAQLIGIIRMIVTLFKVDFCNDAYVTNEGCSFLVAVAEKGIIL